MRNLLSPALHRQTSQYNSIKKVEGKIKMKELPEIKVVIKNKPSAEAIKNLANYLSEVAQK